MKKKNLKATLRCSPFATQLQALVNSCLLTNSRKLVSLSRSKWRMMMETRLKRLCFFVILKISLFRRKLTTIQVILMRGKTLTSTLMIMQMAKFAHSAVLYLSISALSGNSRNTKNLLVTPLNLKFIQKAPLLKTAIHNSLMKIVFLSRLIRIQSQQNLNLRLHLSQLLQYCLLHLFQHRHLLQHLHRLPFLLHLYCPQRRLLCQLRLQRLLLYLRQ